MTHASSVLVLGARGRLGSAAVRAFASAGWRVIAQARPGAMAPPNAGVQWVFVDPADTPRLAAAARDATVVVQALSPAYTHRAWRRELPALTEAAIAITRTLGATLMLPASVYNFGAGMPPLLQEDTPQQPTTFKGRMRRASEAQIRAATSDGRMNAVVIRGGDFFGSGTGSWLDQVMVTRLRQGRLTYPGPLDVPTSWAYLPDLARSFVLVAQQRERLAAFETLHFAGYSLTGAQWAQALTDIAREQGCLPADGRLRVKSLSWPLMRVAALVLPTVAALCEMAYLWRTPHALANTRMRALVGEEPHTPFAQALRQSLDELAVFAPAGKAAVDAVPARGLS